MSRLARGAALWGPPLALMALIFAFSAMPNHDPDRGVLEFLLRKVVHFSEYALLATLWWRALRTRLSGRTALAAAVAISVAYAATDEFHQHFVDGRVSTPVDVLIDAAGAAAAAALVVRRRVEVRA